MDNVQRKSYGRVMPRKKEPPKRGRPKSPLEEQIYIRTSAEDRAAWEAAAEADGRTLSAWIRHALNSLVRRG